MRRKRRGKILNAPLSVLLLFSLMIAGNVPAAGQGIDGVAASGPVVGAEGRANIAVGVAAAGARIDASMVPQGDAADPGAERPARGTQFGPLVLAALKRAIEQGDVAVPVTADVDEGDGGVVETAAEIAADVPSQITEFAGIGYTSTIPPDPTTAAGPSDLIQAVNRTWRSYTKAGAQQLSTTLASWFSGVLPGGSSGWSLFDPWAIYDVAGGRFILLASAKKDTTLESRLVLWVSDNTSAGTGTGCNFGLNAKLFGATDTGFWADYPKAGVNNNSIILTANMFNNFTGTSSFQYAKIWFLPKSQLYNLACPGFSHTHIINLTNPDGSLEFTVQPALSEVNSNFVYTLSARSGGGSSLTLRQYTTTSANPPVATLAKKVAITVNSYTTPPDAQQPGTTTRIDTGDARLLMLHRNSGGTLWAASTTGCTFGAGTVSCLRWYQINGGTNAVLQQQTFGASGGFYYYFPAISSDSTGRAMIVFNRSGTPAGAFASIRYTGRTAANPLSTLQGSAQLEPGQGCYVKLDSIGRNRWGDYNGISRDPAVANRWWITSEYASGVSATCGNNVWATRIGQVQIT